MAPVIFSIEDRNNIRNRLLENGFNLIKSQGYKKTSVEDVAIQSGIAKGTFYNFFASKELFVAEIVSFKGMQFKKQLINTFSDKPLNTRGNVFEFIKYFVNDKECDLYFYLSYEEMNQILSNLPEVIPTRDSMQESARELLALIPNRSEHCDWKVVANYIKMIKVIYKFGDNAGFIKSVFNKNIDSIVNLIVDEIL